MPSPLRSTQPHAPAARVALLLGLVALAAAVAVNGVVTVAFRENDFLWHYELGQAVLRGEWKHFPDSYVVNGQPMGGVIVGQHYLVGRQVLDAGVALLPHRLSRALFYLAAVGATLAMFAVWRRLAPGPHTPGGGPRDLPAALLAVGLLSAWFLRDLDECGLHLLLAFLLTLGLLATHLALPAVAGLWLGLAATWKTTGLLFLPLLLWKRRWREAAWMGAFLVLFNLLLPLAVLGPQRTGAYWRGFGAFLQRVRATTDPRLNAVENPKPQNQALVPALARYLQSFPPEHAYFRDTRGFLPRHPLFFPGGPLEPPAARAVIAATLGLLALGLAWRFRRPWGAAPGQSDIAPEWAAVMILTSLLSPLCWLQHLVLALPAAFLVLRDLLTAPARRWRWLSLGLVALGALVLQRGVLGRELGIVALSWQLPTLAALLLMALVLTLRRDSPPREAAPPAASRAGG